MVIYSVSDYCYIGARTFLAHDWSISMKLKDKFNRLKQDYRDSLVLIKSGSFFVTFGNDAILMNYFFSYQINNDKIGFPLSQIDKITNLLKKQKVSLVIVDDGEYVIDSIPNDYNVYFTKAKKININEKMNDLLLEEIKVLIESNNENYNKIKRFIDEL